MGICFGAIIYDNLFTHLINPDNKPALDNGFYPAEVNERFQDTWVICVSTYLILIAFGLVLIFKGPSKKKKVKVVDGQAVESKQPSLVEMLTMTHDDVNAPEYNSDDEDSGDENDKEKEIANENSVLASR